MFKYLLDQQVRCNQLFNLGIYKRCLFFIITTLQVFLDSWFALTRHSFKLLTLFSVTTLFGVFFREKHLQKFLYLWFERGMFSNVDILLHFLLCGPHFQKNESKVVQVMLLRSQFKFVIACRWFRFLSWFKEEGRCMLLLLLRAWRKQIFIANTIYSNEVLTLAIIYAVHCKSTMSQPFWVNIMESQKRLAKYFKNLFVFHWLI